MGNLNYTVGKYAPTRGQAPALMSSYVKTSDSYGTTTSASFVEDGSGDIELAVGDIFSGTADEAMWVRFGGAAATVGDGHYFPANVPVFLEVHEAGKVSAIDVS